MFDVDRNGSIEFDEFYLLVCMMIAIKVSGHMLCSLRSKVHCAGCPGQSGKEVPLSTLKDLF